MKSPISFVIFLLVAGGAGWLGGKLFRKPAETPAPPSTATPPKPVAAAESFLLRTAKVPVHDATLADRSKFLRQIKATNFTGDLKKRLREVEGLTNKAEREARSRYIYLRWLEISPESALAEFLVPQAPMASEAAKLWGRINSDAAMAWAYQLKNYSERTGNYKEMVRAYAESNPEAYLANKEPHLNHGQEAFENHAAALRTLALRNPAEAIEKYLSLPRSTRSLHGLQGLAQGYATMNPKAALEWAKNLKEPKERSFALGAMLGIVAETDPHAAKDAIALIDPNEKLPNNIPFAQIAAGLARLDLPEAVAWVRSLNPSVVSHEEVLAKGVAPALADATPSQIVQLFSGTEIGGAVEENVDPLTQSPGMLQTLLRWNPANPAAHLAEISAMPSSQSRDCMINYLAWRWANEDPAAAFERATAATDPVEKQRLLQHAAARFAELGDATKIAESVKHFPDSAEFTTLARTSGGLLAKHHPEYVTELLGQLPEALRGPTALKMADELGQSYPGAVESLAAAVPEAERPGIYANLAISYAKTDLVGADRWLATLPAGPAHDNAAKAIASAQLTQNPFRALEISQSFIDPKARANFAKALYADWKKTDATAALEALRQAGFSPQEIMALRTPATPPAPQQVE